MNTTIEPPSGALAGITVLDAGLLVQAPQAGQLLHDLGAEVTKVELPGFGDQARWIPAAPGDPGAPFFVACNRGKRSIALDLRTPAGRDVFLDLVVHADVVLSNFALGTMDGWGLGYAELAAANPGIVVATGTTFGSHGSDARRKGADLLAQAAGGLMAANRAADGRPTPVGITIADHIASQNMVSGVLAALLARATTGRGQAVDVSLLGGQIFAQASEYTATAMTGIDPGSPVCDGHRLIPGFYGVLPTADGHVAIAGVPPPSRPAFFELIGRPDLADDERFAIVLGSHAVQQELFDVMAECLVARPTREWAAEFDVLDVRWAPVNDRTDVIAGDDPYANGYLVRGDGGDDGEPGTVVGTPIELSDTPVRVAARAPELGEHTEEILLELGYSWDRIAELRDAGITAPPS